MLALEPSVSPPPTLPGGQFFRYTLSAALTALFLWIAFRGTDIPRLWDLMRDANYWWMLVMLVCLVSSHVVRAWRWRFLLAPIKPDARLRNLFSGVMIGYLINNILPRAGEIARPYAIGKLETISKSSAFGTIVVERILDTFSFLILVALLPFIYDGPLLTAFPWLQRAGVIITLGTSAGLAVMIALMIRRDWTDHLVRVATRFLPSTAGARLERLVHSFLDGFLFLRMPSSFLLIALGSVVIWFLYILMIYTAFFAFRLGDLGFRAAVVVQTISSIGVAIPTPGGTGGYHAFTSQSLVELFRVDPALALSYATVTHAVGYLGVTVIGLYYFVRDQISISDAVGISLRKAPRP